MRIGTNPQRNKKVNLGDYFHQVIIPVYIPYLEEYYKGSFEVFKLSIQSLITTSHSQTFISVISNGCCNEVNEYIIELYNKKKIHDFTITKGIGKVNSILKGLTGTNLSLVTITDADVLFLNGWQKATYDVFDNFPKSGVVGLTPQFKMFVANCGNVLFENLFSNKMKFTKVENAIALKRFYESIGWDNNYNHDYLKYNLCIEANNCKALIGSGHFVATYRRAAFDRIISYNGYKLGGNSVSYIDRLPLQKGFWRLTTADNYAYHLGNVIEDWMKTEIAQLQKEDNFFSNCSFTNEVKNISKVEYFIKNKFFTKLFSNERFKKIFYKLKELPNKMIQNY